MTAPGGTHTWSRLLVLRVHAQLCGVPLAHVLETCRPLPTAHLVNAPAWVSGLALVRARATPVVDARRLLGRSSEVPARRFVLLKLGHEGTRVLALAVDDVVGIRDVPSPQLESLPGLLHESQSQLLALGTLDRELLLLLDHARLLPDALWAELEQRATA